MNFKIRQAVRAVIAAWGPKPKPAREVQFVPYKQGDAMLKSNEGWRLAPEEDTNHVVGWVWLERIVTTNEEPKL